MTITDRFNNITGTIILLSEKFDSCYLTVGLLNSFGIAQSDISAETLVNVCVPYEGRRLELRDHRSIAQEAQRLVASRPILLARLCRST